MDIAPLATTTDSGACIIVREAYDGMVGGGWHQATYNVDYLGRAEKIATGAAIDPADVDRFPTLREAQNFLLAAALEEAERNLQRWREHPDAPRHAEQEAR